MFVNLTKTFDSVSRTGLYNILEKIGCPPKTPTNDLCSHDRMTSRVVFDGDISETFKLSFGVKQGYVMAPTLFGIYLSTLLCHVFPSPNGIALYARHDGNLFSLAYLRAK